MSSRSLSEQAFLVLTALAEEPKHGYAIMQAVSALSAGRVQLPVATLYGVLDRLIADGLVDRDRDETHQGRLRRYYRLTDAGVHALANEAHRLAANLRAVRTALRAHGVRTSPAEGTS